MQSVGAGWRALACAASIAAAAACSHASRPARAASVTKAIEAPPSDAPLSDAERRALFDAMVDRVRRDHVFAKHTVENLGRTFDDELPALARDFAAARTTDALRVALHHFVDALHDAHCRYRPSRPGAELALPIDVDVEWIDGRARFYVSAVHDSALRASVADGDVVVAVDGVADVLSANALASNRNNWRGIARDVARFLHARGEDESLVRAGDVTRFTLRARAGGAERVVPLRWAAAPEPQDDTDFAVDYASAACGPNPPIDYEHYALRARGARYCLYTSTESPYSAYPIVRQFGFDYFSGRDAAQLVLADHASLSAQLAAVGGARGVVLDLRENRGGNNENVFLDWWAPRPYVDTWTHVRLDRALDSADALDAAGADMSRAQVTWYLAALAHAPPDARFTPPRPFMCAPTTCDWSNAYAPAHPVTRLPTAIVVGPGCSSACDAFVLQYEEGRFGPIVGEPPVAGFTTHRLRLRVPARLDLGTYDLAFTYDTSSVTGDEVEGRATRLDRLVERTFESRARHDALLVDAAIERLAARAAPGQAR